MLQFTGVRNIFRQQRTRIARGFWSGLDAGATPVASLAVSAGLVRALGPEAYGIVVIVLAVSALSLAINPAISAATTKFISECIGTGKDVSDAVPKIITESVITVALIGAGLLSLTYLFSAPFSRALFGRHTVIPPSGLASILVLAVLTICIQQVDGVFSAALKGLERFKEQAIFELISRVAVAGSMIVSAYTTRDIDSVLTTNCIALTISTIFRGAFVKTVVPGKILFRKPAPSDFRKLLTFGSWMWLSATATAAFGTVDRLVVGRVLGPPAVAQFQIYIQVSQLVHYIPSSIFAFSFPAFSRLRATKSAGSETLRAMYRRTFAAVCLMALSIALVVGVFGQPLIALISGGRLLTANAGPYYCLIVGFTLLAMNVAPYYLLLGMGMSRTVSTITSLSVMASILGAVVLIPIAGLWGAALARLVYVAGTLILIFSARTALRQAHV